MNLLVVGMGSAGKRHYIEFESRGWDIVGLDPDTTLDREGLTIAHSWDSAIVKDTQFDVAVIASPPAYHIENVHQCMDKGIAHILLEKPMCAFEQLTESFQLRDRVLTNGVKVQVAYNYRWHPAIKQIRRMWGKIKRVKLVSRAKRDPKPTWGVILDQVAHAVDTLRFVSGGIPYINSSQGDEMSQVIVEGAIVRQDEMFTPFSISESMDSDDGRVVYWEIEKDDGTQRIDISPSPAMFYNMTSYFLDVVYERSDPFPSLEDAAKTQDALSMIKRKFNR